ncbi:MAG: O-antigen ligase family protein [Bacteriovorax sp.]|nr:O-antigen ligase family protein [Bacteriovorax sp.]
MNQSLEKTLCFMIYGSLMVLAIGLVTSPTILALSHILMAVPMIYFAGKANYKSFSKSAWALLIMAIMIILSVLCNQDIAVKGYAPLTKTKYFLIGFFSLAPYAWYFQNHYDVKKISRLFYVFCTATTFASLVGIFSRYWGFNPVTWREISTVRNAGLFGMVMNYAHNLSFFLIIITGMVFYRNKIKEYINLNFLYAVFLINLIGLYLTYTRGAWLAYLVAVPFFLFKSNKKTFGIVIVAAAILGGVLFKLAGNNVIRPDSEKERISQWQAAFAAFQERPVLGYGYLNFEQHSRDIKEHYDLPEKQFGGHAHSNLFEMLGSTGLLGFIAFSGWLLFWLKETIDDTGTIANISFPFILVFFVGGLSQSTISLGINLFFIMAVYSLTQINSKVSKFNQNL